MRYRIVGTFLCSLFSITALAAELPAKLAWANKLVLSTTVTGVVETVKATAGQQLKKADVILALDQREFLAAVKHAEAVRLAASTTYSEAKRETQRSQELFEKTMISEHELQVVKNSQAQAKAAFLAAGAKLQQAKIALERSRITAPFDGVVLRLLAQPGQTVLSTLRPEPLAVIAAAGHMVARAGLTAAELEKFSGLQATHVVVGSHKFAALDQRIAYEADDNGLYAIDVRFKVDDNRLRAGQAANIIFP